MTELFNFNSKKFLKNLNDPLTTRTRLFTGYTCNIDCKFCFYRGMKPKDIKEDIYKQIELAKEYGITDFDISGGEPTILPYWFDLLGYLVRKEFRKIAVITNGYKLSNIEFFQKSIDHGLNEVLFSLHAPDETMHDNLTGVKGSFKKVMKGIENALELGILLRINTVVTNDNYKHMTEMAKLVNNIKPHSFNFLPFRIENSAEAKGNYIDLSESIKYIKESIDILDKNIVINVRYVPFCLMIGYEKYVCSYIQRMYDTYDWSEGITRILDCVRREIPVPRIIPKQTFQYELDETFETLKLVSGYKFTCLKCKNLYICEGIWKNNNRSFSSNCYYSVPGQKIDDILYYRRVFNG